MSKKRYAIFHESEPGWETAGEAQDWIANRPVSERHEYRVVAFEPDAIHVKVAADMKEQQIERIKQQAIELERLRIRSILGI